MTIKKGPLAGLRVLDFGHYIAGPLAGVFLADQGAEVIQVRNPRAKMWDSNTEAALARGKRSVDADLKDMAERQRIFALASECDVILENFRPGVMARLGLGYEAIAAVNPGVIYVSMPGYSRHDPRAPLPVWDGSVNAASGLYTDLAIGGAAVDLPPIYTPLALPSVYAGLWGAISALAALYARQSHGHGDRIEVPLMDAAMSAAAGVIFQIADQPARYNAPPVSRRWLDRVSLRRLPAGMVAKTHDLVARMMPPLFRNYVCGDGQQLFICAIDNANHIAKLVAVMGMHEEVERLGFVFGHVLDVPPTRNNITAYRGTSAKWRALRTLLKRRFATATADDWGERLALAGIPAVRQRSLPDWLSMPVMHDSGILVKRTTAAGKTMIQPAPQVDVEGMRCSTQAVLANDLSKVSTQGWATAKAFSAVAQSGDKNGARQAPLAGVRVLDLANVIAGPAAGRTLAELGAEVIHVCAVTPRMGPRMTLLLGMEVNQGKRSLALDLHQPSGREAIHSLLPETDVLLYNKLPDQARRLGVAPEQVHAINESTVVSAVTAYGGTQAGGWEGRPAYDPVIQALTGVMQRFGSEQAPAVHGIASCIDYFTGYSAAFGAVLGLVARSQGDHCLVARTSLVRTAGWVQLPQVCNPEQATPTGLAALGGEVFDRLYRARGGWVHVDAGPAGAPPDVPTTPEQARAWLTREMSKRDVEAAVAWARGRGLVAQAVLSARHLRSSAVEAESRGSLIDPTQVSGCIVRVRHPAGESYFAPDATWMRFAYAQQRRIAHAPAPGQHSVDILTQAGYLPEQIDDFLAKGISAECWPALRTYIPD
ncbi:MAG: CoA transferase [Aquabacterium sp.]|uniref:CoA transferase n=1 Tax=Aquabacterium sp. TaxID=1872578 RepID=UPI002717FDA5|nr:CoA transferase [Aquabacterium sp.]MDO9003953.1 CoA transferase [Aquabacterium sp.]